jgi:hypothetical protein
MPALLNAPLGDPDTAHPRSPFTLADLDVIETALGKHLSATGRAILRNWQALAMEEPVEQREARASEVLGVPVRFVPGRSIEQIESEAVVLKRHRGAEPVDVTARTRVLTLS